MSQLPILLLGAGGHTRACIDVIEQEGRFKIIGLIGLAHEVDTSMFGYPIVGTDTDLSRILKGNIATLVTIGQIKTPALRINSFNLLMKQHTELPVIVSPHAYVSPRAKLGAGTIVMHGAVVNAGATVGRNCIINSLALVEHDVVIEDHCHISTQAAVNSGVHIGEGTFIGSNASVRQCLTIGSFCLIGMGQRVLTDCKSATQLPAIRGTE